MAKRMDIAKALDRLAKAERSFDGSEFLAPVRRGRRVQVRIAGILCQYRVEPSEFEGWGVFKSVSNGRARLVREPKLSERRNYLSLLPKLSVILCTGRGASWLVTQANPGDRRFLFSDWFPLEQVEDGDLFETAEARFDGSQFWYEGPCRRTDPVHAAHLRTALIDLIDPDKAVRPGMTGALKDAYARIHAIRTEREQRKLEQARKHDTDYRVQEALSHAGAQLRDFSERGEVVRVSYTVDGQRFTSALNKNDLSVLTAGVCLAGQDDKFDLASLVGVLREGEKKGELEFD